MYFLLCVLLHPYYGNILDADAIGYLSIAERVANADWFRSINGLWSPLNSWLLVPFIQKGYDGFLIAKIINFILGGILIIQTYFLCHKYIRNIFYINCVLFILPFVIVYYAYLQVFADMLQLVFILFYLQICIAENYFSSYKKIITAATLMSLAYYSKAYSLPFYFLHTLAISIWIKYGASIIEFFGTKYTITLPIKPAIEKLTKNKWKPIVGIFTFILLIAPWVYQLHTKYDGISLTGNSGKLNMSWNLIAHKEFKEDIKILIPPTYNNSVSFWEDPYPSQAKLHTPFESVSMFLQWIFRIGHTIIKAIICTSEISAFCLAILLFSIWYFYFKNPKREMQLLVITAFILPLGYLSMHIETRYIWLLTFILIILTGSLLDEIKSNFLKNICTIIFCVSLIIYPLFHLEIMHNKGKDNFEMASALNKANIHGKFITNNNDAGKQWAIAYLSKNKNYTIENYSFTSMELENEIKRYGIEYYWHYSQNSNAFAPIFNGSIKMLKVLEQGNYQVYKLIY
jgi:hypothetical protein